MLDLHNYGFLTVHLLHVHVVLEQVHYTGLCCYGDVWFPRPLPLQGKFLVVITSTGAMYSQPIIPACSAVEGPVYFNIDIAVKHPSIQVS